jgi:hypothetical protein
MTTMFETEEPSSISSNGREDPDFRPMVRRAVLVALIGWCTKVVSMLKVNAELGGKLHVRRWGPGVPYFAFEMPRSDFVVLTSKSTVMLSFVLLALLVAGILRNRSRIHVAGWCFSVVALGYSIAADLLLNRWTGHYVDLSRLRWAYAAGCVSCLLIAWWIAIEHPHQRLHDWRNEAMVPVVQQS